MPLTYEDLTKEQIEYVFNGVGSPFFIIDPHDLIYKPAARVHDVLYYIGGEEKDRKAADKRFKEDCWKATKEQKWYVKPFYYITTPTYCFFVTVLGKYTFEYGPKTETWEELKARVDKDRNHFQELHDNKKWWQFWIK